MLMIIVNIIALIMGLIFLVGLYDMLKTELTQCLKVAFITYGFMVLVAILLNIIN